MMTIDYHGTTIRILQPRHVPAKCLPMPTFQLGSPSVCFAHGDACPDYPFRDDNGCQSAIARVLADLSTTHPEVFL